MDNTLLNKSEIFEIIQAMKDDERRGLSRKTIKQKYNAVLKHPGYNKLICNYMDGQLKLDDMNTVLDIREKWLNGQVSKDVADEMVGQYLFNGFVATKIDMSKEIEFAKEKEQITSSTDTHTLDKQRE